MSRPDRDVRLVPMHDERYLRWRTDLIVNYAADKVASGAWAAEDSERLAAEAMEQLLPDGVATADHMLLQGVDADGAEVGTLWWNVDRRVPDRPTAFLYDIVVAPEHRGQGWGRALLAAGEAWCAEGGVREFSLHVFGHNQVAYGLYRSAGYEVTDYSMRKKL